jgi:hypothetical protein
MPYIKQQDRNRLEDEAIEGQQMLPHPRNAGELNYIVTVLAHQYWRENGQNYQAFNDIIGALEGAKLELYRKRVAPYEDIKIIENGDV